MVAVLAVGVVAVVVTIAGPSAAAPSHDGAPAAPRAGVFDAGASVTTSVPDRIPATTLEAEARDDGTQPAPWLIGSALAAGAVILIGGSVLRRRER